MRKFLHEMAYDQIKTNIVQGIWADCTKLPTEYELMEQLKISRDTLRKALLKLAEEGYIYRKAGDGTFVRSSKSLYRLNALESFSEQMRARGMAPSSTVLGVELLEPPQPVAMEMQLRTGEKTYAVTRIRQADGRVMALESTYISASLCPGIDQKIDANASLYELYKNTYRLKIEHGDFRLQAKNCDAETAKVLGIRPGDAMLEMLCVVYAERNEPLYYVNCQYIGENYVFFAKIPN